MRIQVRADGRHRLVLLKEGAREVLCVLIYAEMIGVDDATGKNQGVKVGSVGIGYREVDVEGVTLFHAIEALELSLGRGHESGSPPASLTACHGLVSSTCSTPSVNRNATFLPVMLCSDIVPPPLRGGVLFEREPPL